MTTARDFDLMDLFKFNSVNLDPLTETYSFKGYLQFYLYAFEYFQVCQHHTGEIMGYIMGYANGDGENFHGHVTTVSVAPKYRRLKLGARLMRYLEDVSERKRCYFVDLFVRVSNTVAYNLYSSLGYVVYRKVIGYYPGKTQDEDAYDMRKALSADVDKKLIRSYLFVCTHITSVCNECLF
uniref:N-alpha-acetyltransferase 20 n=1 Tax=Steinernema glaseri TaxID=37863 RepID=A0A1I7XXI6_9BILA